MKGYLLSDTGVVVKEWIDSNGHMNVTAYVALFDKGADVLLRNLILKKARIKDEVSLVAGRVYIQHRKELLLGENWELWSGIVSYSRSYITSIHKIKSKNKLCAVCQIRSTPFSLATRTAILLDSETSDFASKYLVPGVVDKFN